MKKKSRKSDNFFRRINNTNLVKQICENFLVHCCFWNYCLDMHKCLFLLCVLFCFVKSCHITFGLCKTEGVESSVKEIPFKRLFNVWTICSVSVPCYIHVANVSMSVL